MLFPFQMFALQKPYLHLLHIVDTHTFGYTLLQNIRIFLVKGQVDVITLPKAIIPPCMQHMVNIHLTHPELKQLDHILPRKRDIILIKWDIRLSEEI